MERSERSERQRDSVLGASRLPGAAGVRHAAYTSIPNPTDANPAGVVPDHRATEEHLAASGLQWTFLRNGLYSEYRIPEAQAAVTGGGLRHNLGDGRPAFVDVDVRHRVANDGVGVATPNWSPIGFEPGGRAPW